MEQAAVLKTALANTARLVEGISDEHWDASTPCSRWNVRQLVNHTAGVMANFRNGARNETVAGDPDEFDLGPDPAATFAALSAGNVAAWNERGELDSIVKLGDNEFPGAVAITINMLDAYVHGWDIAQATGQDARLDPDLCVNLLGFSQQAIPPAPREGDRFHAVVPVSDGADAVDQLLGYLGRQP
ncbi:MAG: TIGR03086 family metal-binding protein [Ilumatobacter sp.]|uniref:TIGR03086 family metal-binding protein n=1 Tax=Ilumatobacter sp. TaxID=1967498 RepID=UPI003C793D00